MTESNTRCLGNVAERWVMVCLEKQGWVILEHNIRCCWGEMDIVALDHEQTLVFCEVKARRSADVRVVSEAIDLKKQERLYRLAEWYLAEHPEHAAKPCRFDALLLMKKKGEWYFRHVADAFRPGW